MPWKRRPATAVAGQSGPDVIAALIHAEEGGAQMPDDLFRSVRAIVRRLRSLTARAAAQPIGSVDVYVTSRMATDYLPQTLDAYLRIPAGLRMRPAAGGGASAHQLAREQLALLEAKLVEVDAAMTNRDQDALAVHGRFLDEKFGSSLPNSLTLPPAD